MNPYDHIAIESYWQKKWEEEKTYATDTRSSKPTFYGLVEFPYPSGAGLHVGHVRSYTGMDVIVRKKRMEGFETLFPIGWDAFGLPAENYAIKTGIHPSITTRENIDTFRKQLQSCGFSFDWDREVDTTDPLYYKWTQWIFLKLYEKGLAYKKEMPVNWCPKDKCVLANEEVVDGKCERCGTPAEKRNKEQWMLAITRYAERLDKDLDETEFLDRIKTQQRNWIGMSEGSEIDFTLTTGEGFTVYTTRADTLFGCTYCVLAPEHALVKKLLTEGKINNKEEVEKYVAEAIQKIDIDRSAEGKEKTGVQLEGIMAINPGNQENVPVYIADYVLATYGTGAIMAVPAHDERDGEFAKKYGIKIKEVITAEGVLINSGSFDTLTSADARVNITQAVGGRVVKKSKLRDWVFARQRYWGEPIPLVYDKEGKMYPVHTSELPTMLPQVDKYEPTDNGESPLYQVPEWVHVSGYVDAEGYFHTKEGGESFRRETDTMPQWAGSSWYFMRYIDPRNAHEIGSPDLLKKWLPVTWYNGGMEHTTLHLLYSRFWYKFLFDIGIVPNSEPYFKRTSQGMILGEGGVKMSKSLGNVINPDVIVKKFGADTLRMYEMFIGPFDQAVAWDDKSVIGVRRFLDRAYMLQVKVKDTTETLPTTHRTVKKVGDDISSMSFNTAIASLMICLNEYEKADVVPKEDFMSFIKLLAPFAPFMAEELWKNVGGVGSVHLQSWPTFDETKLEDDTVTYVLQINGKVRGEVVLPKNAQKDEVLQAVRGLSGYANYVGGTVPKKEIFVPGKLINIVI